MSYRHPFYRMVRESLGENALNVALINQYIHSRLSFAGASSEIIGINALLVAYRRCTRSISRLNTILTKAFILVCSARENSYLFSQIYM